MFKRFLLTTQILLLVPALIYAKDNCGKPVVKEINNYLTHVASEFQKIKIAGNNFENSLFQIEKDYGEFDPRLNAKSISYLDSFYTGANNQIAVKKQNQLLGSQFELGYRNGRGNFPVWNDYLETTDSGELFATLRIPLLQNLNIDKLRLNYKLAIENSKLKEAELLLERLNVVSDFFNELNNSLINNSNYYVLTGVENSINEQNKIISEKVQSGALPNNDLVENQRLLLNIQREKLTQETALKQKLNIINQVFLDNYPSKIESCELPNEAFKIEDLKTNDFKIYQLAINNRPDLAILNHTQSIIQERIDFSENQLLPNLDFRLDYENGVGSGPVSDAQESTRATLEFNFPIFNRSARNQLNQELNELKNINHQITLNKNQINNSVYAILENIKLFKKQYQIYTTEVNLLEKLLNADYENYNLGNLNLFQVNQREILLLNTKLKKNETFFKLLSAKLNILVYTNQIDKISQIFSAA